MKVYVIKINHCIDCPEYAERGGYCLRVKVNNRGHKTIDNYPIPDWCPLPNSKEE